MKTPLVTLTIFVMMLISCGEKTQTEEWYMTHPEELKKEVAKCNTKSIAEIIQDKHCQAIEKARQKVWREQQKNAQPIKLKF